MSSMILVVQVGFENSSYLVAEDAGPVSVCVTVTGQLVRDIVVTLSTVDGSAMGKSLLHSIYMGSLLIACATLLAPGDYTFLTRELTFNQGVRQMCEDITIVPDSTNEVIAEMFSMSLSFNDSAVTPSQRTATVSIGMPHGMLSEIMHGLCTCSLFPLAQLTALQSLLTLLHSRIKSQEQASCSQCMPMAASSLINGRELE